MQGKCRLCKAKGSITKHSLLGSHKPPYVFLCRICHDKVHGFVRINKKEKAEIKSWKREQFKKKLPFLS